MAKSRNWDDYMVQRLDSHPEEIPGYLTACYEEGAGAFLIGLKHVIDAREGMSNFSRKTKLHRVSIHKMLSDKGNPRFESIAQVMEALGLGFSVVENPKPTKEKSKTG